MRACGVCGVRDYFKTELLCGGGGGGSGTAVYAVREEESRALIRSVYSEIILNVNGT